MPAALWWLPLVLLYSSLLAYVWLLIPTRRPLLIAVGTLLIAAAVFYDAWRRGETVRSAGLTLMHGRQAIVRLAPPTLAVVALLFVLNAVVPGAPRGRSVVTRALETLPWALLQQALLQVTFNRRLTAALGPTWRAALLNGLLFGGMHLPGPLLVSVTIAAGTWWSRVYQAHPNLWALALSHAVLSAVARATLPPAWFHGFRVGVGYFRWR
jgi:hypothetical protein